MGYMTYPVYYGYSSGSVFIGILTLILKAFTFALIVAFASAIIMLIKNSYLKAESTQAPVADAERISSGTKASSTAAVIGAVILGVVLIYAFLNRYGMYRNNWGNVGNFSYTMAALLIFTSKILVAFLLISLIMASISMIREQSNKGKPLKSGEVE